MNTEVAQIEYEVIKSRTNKLLYNLKEIKEFFGTLTDCEILHALDFARFDWLYAPAVMNITEVAAYFVWCVEQNIFTLISTDDGKKYSNFSAFNRSGYRHVEAFLRTIDNYWCMQNLEVQQQWAIENPVLIAFSVLNGSKRFAEYEAELFAENIDFFPKTNEGRLKLIKHRENMAALEIARTIVDAMPDFDIRQLFANAKEITPDSGHFDFLLYDFISIAESILGYERPKDRLSAEQSNNQLRLVKYLKSTKENKNPQDEPDVPKSTQHT